MLVVGDSLTQAGIYTQHLLELAEKKDGPTLTLIGSRGPDNSPAHGSNRFEGYNGWTAEAFATFHGPLARSGVFKPGETGSPFVFEANGKKTLDFGEYCRQFNNSEAPDFVTFALGTNDVFAATDDNIDSVIGRVFLYYDSLIDMVHGFNKSTRIGVVLIIPPSEDQDGFRGYRPPERQTRWQYRRNQHRLIERMIEHFGRRESENIFLINAYLNFDAAHNFVTRPMEWNAENPEQTARVIDGIHPAASGYRQMADSIYAWMRTMLAGGVTNGEQPGRVSPH